MGVETNCKKILDNENYKSRGSLLRRVQLKKACLLAGTRKKTMCYSGHIIRHITLQHAILEGKIEDRRSRGRSSTMWMGNITEWS